MWDSQRDFHKFPNQVTNFIKSVFTEEYCDLGITLYNQLMLFQKDYTTYMSESYPYQVIYPYDFQSYLNEDAPLSNQETAYTIDIAENVVADEYLNRLYFRRRQGWGKSIIKKITI